MTSAERTQNPISINRPDSPAGIRRRGEYGIDGGIAVVLVMTGVAAALLTAKAALAAAGFVAVAVVPALLAAFVLATLGISLHTTRRGKFLVWAEILDGLGLRGDERALDAGCGRGAVLTMLAERLPRGRAVGIDIWSKRDQSGNSAEAAERNLAAEGVAERCELVTGDMRSIPFPDAAFDLIVSSWAIHNIHGSAERSRAIDELARTLAPGGRVAIADLAFTGAYAQRLEALGFLGVRRRRLGWRFWWGPGFPATVLVTGIKPGPPK
jgi:arsenite methyltransferase